MILPALFLGAVASTAASVAIERRSIDNEQPIVNLGSAGTYQGVLQNNGTVESWKGIPYAKPPVGPLRFMPPSALEAQNDTSVFDATTDALRCVQFTGAPYGVINSNIVGVRAGPGQEDCLKLWIWKPTSPASNSSLPVMFYVHGGALQYSAAPNNDFSDWVGQSQDFIAVNVGYRLGALGFMAHTSLPSANAGLLDQRLALKWVKENIGAFGGNPEDITIMGQSGGGYAVVSQLALYDGDSEGLFQKAIPRSVQRSPMFEVEELSDRNAALFDLLNCTTGQSQLDCYQEASVPALVDAYAALGSYVAPSGKFQNLTFGSFGAFAPMIDGVTLTDSITRLFKAGKIADVPVIAGAVNDEGANTAPRNATISPASSQIWNLTESQVEKAITLYPVNETFGSSAPDQFFLNDFKAYIQSLGSFGEVGITGSERLIGRYMSEAFGPEKVWTFRFNAPTVGTNYTGRPYPLSYVAHSADNSYLQNATATMSDFEKAIAYEWRAYLGSFIRTGNPNSEKLEASTTWQHYGFLGDFIHSPIRLVPQFGHSWITASDDSTGTQVEVAQKAQNVREEWWTSEDVLDATRL